MDARVTLNRTKGGLVAKKLEVPLTRDLLNRMGRILVDCFSKEAAKDFAKRGWSGLAEDGSASIWDSFSYVIQGGKTVEVVCSFPHIDEMVSGETARYKMTWMTQAEKNENPSKFPLTERERELGMKRGGKVSQGERLPLVVPLKTKSGVVIFRAAPLTFQDAWVHPGIARFTFVQRASKRGREQCLKIIQQEVLATVVQELGK